MSIETKQEQLNQVMPTVESGAQIESATIEGGLNTVTNSTSQIAITPVAEVPSTETVLPVQERVEVAPDSVETSGDKWSRAITSKEQGAEITVL